MKKFYLLLLFFIYSCFCVCDNNFFFNNNIAALSNCIIFNSASIRNLNCNGKISFSQNPKGSIIINIVNSKELTGNKEAPFLSGFFIDSLSTISLPDVNYFISIDNNNNLYLLPNENNIPKNNIIIKKFLDTELIGNIETATINSNTVPIVINSQNKLLNNIDIKIGNQNNNIIILSKLILNINEINFNDTINYPIICDSNTTIFGNLEVRNIFIGDNMILNNQNTINFNNIFINGNLNNNAINPTIIQGHITWNNNIALGNTELPVNFVINSLLYINNISKLFCVLDSNNVFYITNKYPSIETLSINNCMSNEDIDIYPLITNSLKNITIGNQVGNIFFNSSDLFFSNDILTQNTILNILVDNNTFISDAQINNITNINNIIGNGLVNISGNITINNLVVSSNLYMSDLPIITNPIAHLVLIPINNDNNQNILVGLQNNTFFNSDGTKVSSINNFENKINRINIILSNILEKYLMYEKEFKKLLNQLYIIDKECAFLKKNI